MSRARTRDEQRANAERKQQSHYETAPNTTSPTTTTTTTTNNNNNNNKKHRTADATTLRCKMKESDVHAVVDQRRVRVVAQERVLQA